MTLKYRRDAIYIYIKQAMLKLHAFLCIVPPL